MNVRMFLLTGLGALALYAAPVMAADDVDLNSGFGKDMFAGEEHPAFADPSIHDPANLEAIEPAAGAEKTEAVEEKPADGSAREEKSFQGAGGIKSTFETP